MILGLDIGVKRWFH